MAVVGAYGYTPVDDAIIEPGLSPAGVLTVWDQFKAAINTIDLAQMNTNSVGTDQLLALNVTTAKIALDAITNALIADEQIDSEHYVDGSIDTAHLGNAQVTAAKLGNMFEAAQDDEVATDTVTETDWHDIVGSSVAVTLDVASDVMALGFTTVKLDTAGLCYLRVVYNTGAGDTQIGQDLYNKYGSVAAGEEYSIAVGGIAANLSADDYTFKLQAKVSTGSGTYLKNNLSVISVPHR